MNDRRMGYIVGSACGLVMLFWWSSTDRLDLPKQAVVVACAAILCLIAISRRRVVPVGPIGLLLSAAQNDLECMADALQKAARDLPTDAVCAESKKLRPGATCM